jgi:hypothetical protein
VGAALELSAPVFAVDLPMKEADDEQQSQT